MHTAEQNSTALRRKKRKQMISTEKNTEKNTEKRKANITNNNTSQVQLGRRY